MRERFAGRSLAKAHRAIVMPAIRAALRRLLVAITLCL